MQFMKRVVSTMAFETIAAVSHVFPNAALLFYNVPVVLKNVQKKTPNKYIEEKQEYPTTTVAKLAKAHFILGEILSLKNSWQLNSSSSATTVVAAIFFMARFDESGDKSDI